ncbi:MAG: hypothetical protein HOE54_05505, partial [Gammaproteobacteria bacterium]|nr:hypothetical protein [Gammaproteobacteria bacterium]
MAVLKPVTTLFLTLVMTVTGISCACALPIAATVPVMPSAHEHEHEHEQGHMQGHEPGQMSRMDCEQQVCLNDCIDEVALIAEREPMPPVGYFQVDDDDAHDGLIFSVAALP